MGPQEDKVGKNRILGPNCRCEFSGCLGFSLSFGPSTLLGLSLSLCILFCLSILSLAVFYAAISLVTSILCQPLCYLELQVKGMFVAINTYLLTQIWDSSLSVSPSLLFSFL